MMIIGMYYSYGEKKKRKKEEKKINVFPDCKKDNIRDWMFNIYFYVISINLLFFSFIKKHNNFFSKKFINYNKVRSINCEFKIKKDMHLRYKVVSIWIFIYLTISNKQINK